MGQRRTSPLNIQNPLPHPHHPNLHPSHCQYHQVIFLVLSLLNDLLLIHYLLSQKLCHQQIHYLRAPKKPLDFVNLLQSEQIFVQVPQKMGK